MVRQSRASGWGCLLRAVRAYVVFIVGAIGLTVALGFVIAERRAAQTHEAWARESEPMEAFLGRYPAVPNNPAAVALDGMTRPLGIRMMRRPDDPPSWKGANEEQLKAVGAAMGAFEKPKGGAQPTLPPDVIAFLVHANERLDGIVAHVVDGGPLVWEQDVRKGNGAPLPSLLGHRQLASLLLGRAWMSARAGRGAAADRALEASWRISASLLDRPDLIPLMVGASVSRMQHGVLRELPGVGSAWRQRMSERPFAARVPIALQTEASSWLLYTHGFWGVLDVQYMEEAQPPPGGWRTVPRFLTAPYIRLSVAGMSDALLGMTRTLRAERRCDRDMDAAADEVRDSMPRWNIIGRIGTPSVIKAWALFKETDLDRELTERVLLARAERAASGRWPAEGGASQVCEGVSWDYETVGGSLEIRASEPPFHAEAGWDWSVRVRP